MKIADWDRTKWPSYRGVRLTVVRVIEVILWETHLTSAGTCGSSVLEKCPSNGMSVWRSFTVYLPYFFRWLYKSLTSSYQNLAAKKTRPWSNMTTSLYIRTRGKLSGYMRSLVPKKRQLIWGTRWSTPRGCRSRDLFKWSTPRGCGSRDWFKFFTKICGIANSQNSLS